MFDDQKNKILGALDAAHETYYKDETFGGPSLYFHIQALKAARDRQFERFAECTYAMLASWGMHRMDSRGSKMREVGEFYSSLNEILAACGSAPGENTERTLGRRLGLPQEHILWSPLHGDRHIARWELKGTGAPASQPRAPRGPRIHAHFFVWKQADHE
jgi:hypothetical protein